MSPERLYRRLLAACALVAAWGSLYPFRFAAPASFDAAWRAFWSPRSLWTSWADVAGNVVLFVPLGALAVACLRRRGRALAFALAAWVGFALALQLAQLWLPARNAALADVCWNAVGLAVGAGLALQWLAHRREGRLPQLAAVPAALLGAWALTQLFPYAPALDWQQVRASLAPLGQPRLDALQLAAAFGHALAAGCLFAAVLPRRDAARAFGWLLALAVAARALIAGQRITPSLLLGFAAGYATWAVGSRRAPAAGERAALPVLWLAMTAGALLPLRWREQPMPFGWLPFGALLDSHPAVALWVMAQWLFVYGTLLWLARRLQLPLRWAAPVLAGWVLALEVLQRWIHGRVGDITAPLLVLALGWALQRAPRDSHEPRDAAPAAPP